MHCDRNRVDFKTILVSRRILREMSSIKTILRNSTWSTLVCSYVVRKLINPSNLGFVHQGRKFSNQSGTSLVASGMFLRARPNQLESNRLSQVTRKKVDVACSGKLGQFAESLLLCISRSFSNASVRRVPFSKTE